MIRLSLVLAFLTASAVLVNAEEQQYETGSTPLVTAIKELRKKTIPEAYFLLHSPLLSTSVMFAPDTKGGAYAWLLKDSPYPGGTSEDDIVKQLDEAMSRAAGRVKRPQLDSERQRLVFFSDAEWHQIGEATKGYLTKRDELSADLLFIRDFREGILLRIPNGSELAFVEALIKNHSHPIAGLKVD
jgi:hypothetical protein